MTSKPHNTSYTSYTSAGEFEEIDHYSRSLPIIIQLEKIHPETAAEFWKATKTSHDFSSKCINQAHEKHSAIAKGDMVWLTAHYRLLKTARTI